MESGQHAVAGAEVNRRRKIPRNHRGGGAHGHGGRAGWVDALLAIASDKIDQGHRQFGKVRESFMDKIGSKIRGQVIS